MAGALLNAHIRKSQGKAANRRLRLQGRIPAVLYGPRGNFQLEMEEESTRQILEKLQSTHELVELKVDAPSKEGGWQGKVLLQEIQKHHYKNRLIHLDFLEPQDKKPLKLKIQIHVVGESPGVKEGGVLQRVVREIPVLCPADRIPQNIEVDVSSLNMGQTLKVSDIAIPDYLSLQSQENFPVISVVGRVKTLEEEEEEAAALAAELEEEETTEEGETEEENVSEEK